MIGALLTLAAALSAYLAGRSTGTAKHHEELARIHRAHAAEWDEMTARIDATVKRIGDAS